MKKPILTSLFIVSLTFASAVQAATLDDVVASINALRAYIASVVATTAKTASALMYEANPSLPATVAGNIGQSNAAANVNGTSQVMSLSETRKDLTLRDDTEVKQIASIAASDTLLAPQVAPPIFGKRPSADLILGDTNFNLDTLLTPLAYSGFNINNLSSNPPYNFIQAASGLYQPATTISLSDLTPDQAQDIQSSSTYLKYQAALRAYIAAQSVGASNLYQMMANRIPQVGLGLMAGVVDSQGRPIPNASKMQVEEYLATRRSQNKNWYAAMSVASPATVSRETLYVLAEIRQQLYQLQKQNERLLATMSVMELQNAQTTKLNFIQLQQAVQAQVDKAKGVQSNAPTQQNLNIPGLPSQ